MIAREPTQVQGIHHRDAEGQEFRIADSGLRNEVGEGLGRTTKHKSAANRERRTPSPYAFHVSSSASATRASIDRGL